MSFTVLNAGWAVASSALYRDFKYSMREGGIRTPMFIKPVIATSLRERMQEDNRNDCATFTHVRDIMPTILEIAKATHPSLANDKLIKMLGKSLVPAMANPLLDIHSSMFINISYKFINFHTHSIHFQQFSLIFYTYSSIFIVH